MKKEVVVISNGPGLKEVRDEYGHSYDWVQNACNVSDVSFSQSNICLPIQGNSRY